MIVGKYIGCIVRMLKSCSYCGRIHGIKHQCSSKPTRNNKVSKADRFRSTSSWQRKRKQVREDRDLHMCQVCIRELYDTQIKYNYENIQVHHIIPLNDPEGWDKRLDENYLISLCYYHHCLAEDGEIPREELLQVVKEQEEKNSY